MIWKQQWGGRGFPFLLQVPGKGAVGEAERSVSPQQSPGELGGEGPVCDEGGDQVVLLLMAWGFQRPAVGFGVWQEGEKEREQAMCSDLVTQVIIPRSSFYSPIDVVEAFNSKAGH